MVKKYVPLSLFLLLGALLGASFMFENTWDFANYHYYNPWAFINNRVGYDIAPASINTYFNPLIDIPFYFLVQYANNYPRLVSAFQGLYFGLLLFLFFKICILFFSKENSSYKNYWILLALCIAATGFATFSQISSTSNEIQIAALILWAFYILYKNICFTHTNKISPFMVSGFLLGCALGLKLTAISYCISIFLLLCYFYKKINNPFYKIFIFCLAATCGFLLLNGWWMWKMWLLYESPSFPFLNGLFKSEYMDAINFSDKRYLPVSLFEYLFYPFIWAVSICDISVSDYQFIDFRFSFAYLVLICYFFSKKSVSFHFKFLIAFFIISYVIWMALFSILRYAIPLEMITAIFLVKFFKDFFPQKLYLVTIYISFIVIALGILVISSTESGFLINNARDKKNVVYVEPIHIPQNSLILLYRLPTAGVIPSLVKNRKDIRVISMEQRISPLAQGFNLTNFGKFYELKQKIIQNHRGKNFAIIHDSGLDRYPIDTSLLKNKKCRKLLNSFDPHLKICM